MSHAFKARGLVRFIPLVAVFFLTTCSGGEPTAPAPAAPAAPVPQSVRITADTAAVFVGDTAALKASVILSNGTASADAVSWSSSNTAIVSVGASSGLALAVSEGSAVITASFGSVSASVTMKTYAVKAAPQLKVTGSTSGVTVTSDSAQIAAGTMTVSRTSSAPVIKVGDVLAGTDNGSFLQKVTAASGTGTTQTLSVEQATFEEALVDADATILDQFDVPAAMRAAYVRSLSEGGWPEGVTVSKDGVMHLTDTPINFENTSSVGGKSVTLKLTGSLGLRFGAAARAGTEAFEFKLKIKNGKFKRLRVSSTMSFAFDANASASFSGAIAGKTFNVPWPSITLTKGPGGLQCVFVGPVPVCYKVSIVFIPYVETNASLQVGVSQHASMNYGITAGVDYNDGGFEVIKQTFGGTTAQPAKLNFGGNVGMRIGLRPSLEVLLYGAAGPYIGINEYIEMKAGLDSNAFRWYTGTSVGLDLEVGLRAKVLGIKIAEYNNATNLITLPLGSEEGTAATATMSPASVSLTVGAKQALSASVTSDVAGIPLPTGSFSCTSSNSAVASLSGCEVTGVSAGSATITAVSSTYSAVRKTVPVTVTAAAGPLMSLSTSTLSQTHAYGTSSCPQSVGTVTLTNRSSGSVNWTATSSSSSLSLSPASANNVAANGTSQLAVSFNCAQSSSFTGTITVTARNASGSTVENYTIAVTLTVSQALLSLSRTSVSVAHTYTVSPCPTLVGTVTLTAGPLATSWSVAQVGGRTGSLGTSPTGTTTTAANASTALTINFLCDQPVSTSATLRVTATSGSRTETYDIAVSVTVATVGPLLTLSTNTLSATHIYGTSSCPQSVGTVTLTNVASGAVSWTATSSNSSLSLSPASANNVAAGGTSQLAVSFNCAQSTSFTGTVTIAAQSASGSIVQTHTVTVDLTVAHPLLSLSTTTASLTHTTGVTACPAVVGTVTLTAGPLATSWSVAQVGGRTGSLSTSPAGTTTTAAGASTPLIISFLCDQAVSTSAILRVTATSGSRTETFDISVSVTSVAASPLLTLSGTAVSLTHTTGITACPAAVGTVTLTAGAVATSWSVAQVGGRTGSLSSSPAVTTTTAAGASTPLIINFLCDQAVSTSAVMRVTATSGSRTETFDITVTVTVQAPLLTLGSTAVNFSHTTGVTACPASAGNVLLTAGALATSWSVSQVGGRTGSLSTSQTGTTTTAAGASTLLMITFLCDQSVSTSAILRVTATSGSRSETYDIAVTVTIIPPLLSLSATTASVVHTYSVSPCPTLVRTLTLTAGPLATTWSVAQIGGRTGSLGTSPSVTTTTAANASTSLTINFLCDQATSTSAVIRVTATSGSRTETYDISVTVTVALPLTDLSLGPTRAVPPSERSTSAWRGTLDRVTVAPLEVPIIERRRRVARADV